MSSERHGSRSGSHGRHHRSRRFRWLRRNRRWILPALILLLCAAAALGFWIRKIRMEQADLEISSGNPLNVGSGYRDLEYNGKQYRYNNLIHCILLVGIDSEGDIVELPTHGLAPRADSISLLVMDEKRGKMTIIAISRDTMTEIHEYTRNGLDMGLHVDHLGFAYSFGNGGVVSCQNLAESVSSLLYGIPINDYIVANRSSMEKLSDIFGAVSVTVPNNDLADENPEFSAGNQVQIDNSNIRSYLRSRDTGEDFSNVGRMERQKSYVSAVANLMKQQLNSDKSRNEFWKQFSDITGVVQTNITRNKYLTMSRILEHVSFDDTDYYTLDGENVVGEFHDEFYPDREAIRAKVLELFYEEHGKA